MDWYLPNDTAHVRPLRDQIRNHLGRHATPGDDVDGAVIVASELVTNAIQNSEGPIWVSLDWGRSEPVLTVHDLGSGFDLESVPTPSPGDPSGRGLMISSQLVPTLKVGAKLSGGSIVSATLPVSRPPTPSIDPPPSAFGALPHDSEMQPDGTYGRESFLRALVVQLAQTVELVEGPAIAEAVVAQVGADVSGRMEDAYRSVREVEEVLDVDEISELLVELKAAIGGDFFVISADAERIVLGNNRCPFGDAVMQAPALCRMTSSVFGGIARRNRGAAAVDLEQRIAVGDPQCRVSVWLRRPPEDRAAFTHTYGDFDAVERDARDDAPS